MEGGRLDESIKPKNYKIHLKPDLLNFTFKGEVNIELQIDAPTKVIKLHIFELDIEEVLLTHNEDKIKPKSIDSLPDIEMIALNFESVLNKDVYKLNIKFSGKLRDEFCGFFKSTIRNKSEKETYAAITQFQPTHARKCFPSFDEPSFKATFDVSITTVPPHIALSNMPKKQITSLENQEVRYDFQTTPLMSTYLFCVAVGNFDYIQCKTSRGIDVTVYTPKGRKDDGRFCLETIKRALVFFEDYLKINYSLPKLDAVSFATRNEEGAMENWGLMTFREVKLLLDPEDASNYTKYKVAVTVVHETAHQWFGNLVTMKWWNDIWLNEGFATFMQYLGTDHLYPEFDAWSEFLKDPYQEALRLDGFRSSHPIEVEVDDLNEIRRIFDRITYDKGCSVLRMLHHYIGDNAFWKGLGDYLNKFQFKNTETNDLWRCLEAATEGKPIKKIMSTWTKQTGFPLVSVSSERRGDGLVLKLKQERFGPEDSILWSIPITVMTSASQGKECAEILLETAEGELPIPKADPNGWIKVNPNLYGFYRVNYSSELLEKLKQPIIDKSLPDMDRLGILSDMFYLTRHGYIKTVEYLQFIKIYDKETNGKIWHNILLSLRVLGTRLRGTDCQIDFHSYETDMLQRFKKLVGWHPKPNETTGIASLRPGYFEQLIIFNDEETILEGKAIYDSGEKISPEMDKIVARAVAKYNHLYGKEKVDDIHKKLNRTEENEIVVAGLTLNTDPNAVKEFIEFTLSDEVAEQDKADNFKQLIEDSKDGRLILWQYIKDNPDKFAKNKWFNKVIDAYLGSINTKAEIEDYEKFCREHESAVKDRWVKQDIEEVYNLIDWSKRDYDDIKRYLQKR